MMDTWQLIGLTVAIAVLSLTVFADALFYDIYKKRDD